MQAIIWGLYLLQLLLVMRVLHRLGYGVGWTLVAVIPLGMLIGSWWIALSKWPLADIREREGADTFR